MRTSSDSKMLISFSLLLIDGKKNKNSAEMKILFFIFSIIILARERPSEEMKRAEDLQASLKYNQATKRATASRVYEDRLAGCQNRER
jgi:hypothetical protein